MSDLKINLIISVVNDYIRSRIANPSLLQLGNLLVVDVITKLGALSPSFIIDCGILRVIEYVLSMRWWIALVVAIAMAWRYYQRLERDPCSVETPCEKTHVICIDISNMPEYIIDLYKFINMHRSMFHVETGYKYVKCYERLFPIYNDPVEFHDTIHNVRGDLQTRFSMSMPTGGKDAPKEPIIDFQVKITIHPSICNDDYILRVSKYIQKQSRFGNNVELTYNRILSDSMIRSVFYDKSIDDWEIDQGKLKACYFSPHKNFLFDTLEAKATEDITTAGEWNNLLLHGKPGLGKSSFIYRIAIILKKNILSIDMSMYLDRKRDLFAIFNNQPFMLPNARTNTAPFHIQNCIIVLEEFDQSIERLQSLENIHRLKRSINDNVFKTDHLSVGEIKSDSILKINKVMGDLIQVNNQECQSNILRMGDLLELFQSVIPIKDRMIIATTNHLSVIQSAIPALVRPGRLSVVEFECLDWSSFQELCEFYFHESCDCDEFDINVCTAYLVETAIKHKTIDRFIDDVRDKCSAPSSAPSPASSPASSPAPSVAPSPAPSEDVDLDDIIAASFGNDDEYDAANQFQAYALRELINI